MTIGNQCGGRGAAVYKGRKPIGILFLPLLTKSPYCSAQADVCELSAVSACLHTRPEKEHWETVYIES